MISEYEMFKYIKNRYLPDLERSRDYDSWDCSSAVSRMHIELKSRSTHYPELLIEKPKYESLLIMSLRKSFTPWYINATPMGMWAFNLAKLPKPEWFTKDLPATTEFDSRGHRIKTIGYLQVIDGIRM